MNRHNLARAALANYPTRERTRLLHEAAAAATTPEIEGLAVGLVAEIEGMGITTAREVPAQLGQLLGRGER